MHRQRGWTLIEILVVLAIIAVLAGLIYAVGAYAVERARQANCISNLRQIGMALKMYMEDYKIADWDTEIDLIDARQLTYEASAQLMARWGFPDRLEDLVRAGYIKDNRILWCGSANPGVRECPVHYAYADPRVVFRSKDSDELDYESFLAFQQRKNSYPIVVDFNHRQGEFITFIILRMDQSLEVKRLGDEFSTSLQL